MQLRNSAGTARGIDREGLGVFLDLPSAHAGEAAVVGAEMRCASVAFAATGDPGWPRYDAGGTTHRVDVTPSDVDDPLAATDAIGAQGSERGVS